MAYKFYKNITTVNRTVMNNKQNKYIVIHYTGNKTDTAKANADYFKSVNRNASAHYFVDKTSVYQVVEDKDAAWAVGKNYGSGNLFAIVKNNNSLNIEMCSDCGAIAGETFDNAVELTKSLMKKYNIPSEHVYRHYDICSKLCPGWTGWVGNNTTLWNRFKSALSLVPATKEPAVPANTNGQPATNSCLVKLLCDMNIRKTPNGTIVQKNGAKKGITYTIVETSGTWGRLKSGAGWINISDKYVKKVERRITS